MAKPVYPKLKIVGSYAEHLRSEAARRRMTVPLLAADYVMRAIDAERNDASELAGFERRVIATVLAGRRDTEVLQAELDLVVAMVDMAVKAIFLHLPEPAGEREAIQASALARYERYLEEVNRSGFDQDNRPVAFNKIAGQLLHRIITAEESEP